ncbi:hypothetical protein BURK1_03480 [Burkholderiales bacterium]|nr:hypothetical protein BURK1_03480 [Burkholderiales bacterium]
MPIIATLVARHRAWVLAAAVLVGLAAGGGLGGATPPRSGGPALAVADLVPPFVPEAAAAPSVAIRIAANEPGAAKAPADAAGAEESTAPAAAAEAAPAPDGKPKKRAGGAVIGIQLDDEDGRVRLHGADGTREFDSFEAFVDQAPWLAGMVFGVTFLVFLTPILIIALVIWYKVRRTRMINETMIRLAEKGVVPPAEALEAVAGGRTPSMGAVPAAAPLYEQAKAVRRRTAWTDLRKGVVMGAIGLGLVFWAMLEDGSPNVVGLVLMFLGLGYIVLWYFEERQIDASNVGRTASPSPPPGPPSA